VSSASLRFRPPGAILAAAIVAFVGAIPLAGIAWYLAPVLLVPLLVIGRNPAVVRTRRHSAPT